ncbi:MULTISPECIES: hypothetical protein [unclassified Sphingomonas]|uniref:hypothetical protein n=1 Tax=unclassified Sphingomonas TaxID=196159 RepID=UPI002150E83B|nr:MULTISPECIES: hypothetical protein [unclassified Sphingomonas]MCR5870167.1 hypothetical protein [Sphingomonas sp. J344]UUX98142.1 hypothetical protein LRS08_10995 [Sphingomonas sp. J315]
MNRALAIQAGIGIASGAAGIALLRRRAASREGAYALRIGGTMLVALCLFLTGFALVASMAGGV